MDIRKKVVLITGANKGIGFEVARQLAERNYIVCVGSRDKENGQQAVNKLKTLGFTDVDTLEIDVTSSQSIKNAQQELASKFGVLDVLINNAAIAGAMPQDALTIPMDTMRTVFETNLYGPMQVTQQFLNMLKKSDAPVVVNVSSDLGSLHNLTDPDYAFSEVKLMAYNTSKTALNAFTVMLAYELRDTNFKINSVNPGFTATDLNGFTGEQSVEEAAEVIVRYATIDHNGPTGGFFDKKGAIKW